MTKLKQAKSKQGPDLFSQLKNTLGIDKIDFSQGDSEEGLSFQVGKYITQGTMISFSRTQSRRANQTTEANYVGIETELMGNVSLQAEVGDDKNGQLNLIWKRDY